jgi:anti-sigma-K factor RskA
VSTPHDCGGDAAAYALGALDLHEADAFRRHLEQCAVCRDELEALEGVVQALPMSAPQRPVPRRLRRRLMRAVREGAGQMPVRRYRPAFAAVAALTAAAVVVLIALSGGGSSGRLIHAEVQGVGGRAQVRVSGAHGELIVRHLSAPPAGHVYEVWLKAPQAKPVPASVLFTVSSEGNADVGLPKSLDGISQVMVTAEPAGGSPAPTSTPVIVAQLT